MSLFDNLFKLVDEKLNELGFGGDDEVETNVIDIDGVEYAEVMRLEMDGNTYLYFSDLDNPEDFCIRKLEVEDGVEYVCGLDSEEEFDNALNQFTKFFLEKTKEQ